MRRTTFLSAMILSLVTSNALALPTIQARNSGLGSGLLSVITTEPAEVLQVSIAATWNGMGAPADEVLRITGATPSSSDWIPSAALNPFTGLETSGLYFADNEGGFFASFQMTDIPSGVHDFVDLELTGFFGIIDFSGTIIEDGAETVGLHALIPGVVWEPRTMDLDNDGDIDIIDFGIFADAFGSTTGQPNYNSVADMEPDGDVDIIDFGVFADNFGSGTSISVPEPATLLLLWLSLLALLKRKPASL